MHPLHEPHEPHEPGHAGSDTACAQPAEPERLRELLRRHWAAIRRHLSRLGVAASDIDDVAQEVFLVAASKLVGPACPTDRAFLHAVAARLASNARRATHRRRRALERYSDVDRDPPPTPEQLAERLRARALVDRVLHEMTPDLRRVLVLRAVEDASVPEIARRLDLPLGTAASRLRRARETFSARAARALA